MSAARRSLVLVNIPPQVKLVVFDWDMTLYNSYTSELFENVNLLFAELKKLGVPFYVVSGNPENTREKIKTILKDNNIEFDSNYIYCDPSKNNNQATQASERLGALTLIARNEKVKLKHVLLVDDKAEYIDLAKKNALQTLLVDPKCHDPRNPRIVDVTMTTARSYFFESVIQYLKQNKQQNARSSYNAATKNKKKNNRFYKAALAASFIVTAAIIGAVVVAALYVGAMAAVAIGVCAAVVFLTTMLCSEFRHRKNAADKKQLVMKQDLTEILSENGLQSSSPVPGVYGSNQRLSGTSVALYKRLGSETDLTVYDGPEESSDDISEGSSSVAEYSETGFTNLTDNETSPIAAAKVDMSTVDQYSENSFRK